MKRFVIPWCIAICLLLYQCAISGNPDRYYLEFIPAYYHFNDSQIEFLDQGSKANGARLFTFTNNDSFLIIVGGSLIYQWCADFSEREIIYSLPTEVRGFGTPMFSRNRRFLTFTSTSDRQSEDRQSDVYVLDLVTMDLTRLTDTPSVNERFPAISDNGKKIVFSAQQRNVGEALLLYDLETAKTDTLVYRSATEFSNRFFWYQRFIDNDTRVLYLNSAPRGDSLETIKLHATDRKIIDSGRITDMNKMVTSLNGSRVVYSKSGSPGEIVSIKTDGSGYLKVADDRGQGNGYAISNDGETIIVWLVDNGANFFDNGELTIMYALNADGTNRRRLAQGRDATFSNDGSKIIFTALRQRQYGD